MINLFNPLNAELNLICHLLALLGAHPILHIGRIKVKFPGFSLFSLLLKLNKVLWSSSPKAVFLQIKLIWSVLKTGR